MKARKQRDAEEPVSIRPQGWLSESLLRQVIHEVELDEQNAIDMLCSLLEYIQMSKKIDSLSRVATVMKAWTNCPPGVIATKLRKIGEDLGCQTSKRE
jgi:hypothetical protein